MSKMPSDHTSLAGVSAPLAGPEAASGASQAARFAVDLRDSPAGKSRSVESLT